MGALCQLWAFCGANMKLCGTGLSWRTFDAYEGTGGTVGNMTIGQLPPAVTLDLLACGGLSFTGRTTVLTVSGKKIAISRLRIGEQVLASSSAATA